MMSNEKKKNWAQFDGKKVPLENRETYTTKVLENVKTEDDLNNLIDLQDIIETDARGEIIDTLEDAFNKQQDRLVQKIKNHRKDLSKQIYQYIVKNPDVKAKVIANHFNVSRKFINHFLYKKTEFGLKDFVRKNYQDRVEQGKKNWRRFPDGMPLNILNALDKKKESKS